MSNPYRHPISTPVPELMGKVSIAYTPSYPHPAAPQESWLNDPASLEGGEPAAPQGGEGVERLREALKAVTDLLVRTVAEFGCWNPEDHPKVIAARAALAPAAIASGREGAE